MSLFLHHASVGGQQHKVYISSIKLVPSTPQELTCFKSIQFALSQPSILVHYNPEIIIWIDLDISKKFDFGVIIFYTASNKALSEWHWPSTILVKLIFFLWRLLILAKKNYWSTKLEITGFVWVVKKVRYIIESSKLDIIIQTDYLVILNILQHLSITSTILTTRLNLKFVQVSEFLYQFKLNIYHKSGKDQIISDALSYFANAKILYADLYLFEFDALFAFNNILVNIHLTLVSRILANYKAKAWWT